jgi:hypothetical protein
MYAHVSTLVCLVWYDMYGIVVGNYVNGGTPHGRALGFRLDFLNKLNTTKSATQVASTAHRHPSIPPSSHHACPKHHSSDLHAIRIVICQGYDA